MCICINRSKVISGNARHAHLMQFRMLKGSSTTGKVFLITAPDVLLPLKGALHLISLLEQANFQAMRASYSMS